MNSQPFGIDGFIIGTESVDAAFDPPNANASATPSLGEITSCYEISIDDDAGRWRLASCSGDHVLRLIGDRSKRSCRPSLFLLMHQPRVRSISRA